VQDQSRLLRVISTIQHFLTESDAGPRLTTSLHLSPRLSLTRFICEDSLDSSVLQAAEVNSRKKNDATNT
jgi:hypothetical protein